MADLVAALHLDAGTEIALGDLLRQADDPPQRPDDQQADQHGGSQPDQQRQRRRQQNQQRAGLLLRVHLGLLQFIGPLHGLHHAVRFGGQVRVLLALLGQGGGVFLETFVEGVDVADHFGEHGGVAGVLHGVAQLGSELLGIQGFLDLRRLRLLTASALFQAQPGLVERLQEQLIDAADLPALEHQVAALSPLGAFQQVDAIFVQPALQHIEAVGGADHQPVGRFQGQALAIGEFHVTVEGPPVFGHGLGDFAQRIALRTIQAGGQRLAAGDYGFGLLAQRVGVLRIGGEGVVLFRAADHQHVAVDGAHLFQQAGPAVHGTQGGEAGGGHHQGQRQHDAEPQHQFAGGTQAGQPVLQDSPHAPTSPKATTAWTRSVIRFPERTNIGAAGCWRQATIPPRVSRLLFLAKWRSFLDRFLCFLRKAEN
ncbi:hypothetical protein D9M70_378690 [compost metagenome]